MTNRPVESLRLVLGDQLTRNVAGLRDLDRDSDVVLMAEVMDECTYVRHHVKKIVFILSAMRHFTEALRTEGIAVDYRCLGDRDNTGSLAGELARAVGKYRPKRVILTEPGEWRVLVSLRSLTATLGVPVEIREDERFVASHADFARWATGRKTLRMEYFYRDMRRKTGLLLDDRGEPLGGRWNLDSENRRSLPAGLTPPAVARFEPDATTRAVIDLIAARFPDHFGKIEPFWFAVSPADAERAFDRFVAVALPWFGDYQDAMKQGEKTLYHAVISLYLNTGLLDPLAVCRRVDAEYRRGRVPLNAAEGFIRQIIGWREYMRGIYWSHMPDYAETNFFNATRPLPAFYWTGETEMNCLRQCITQTQEEAYAHHIQRLMVTGNFALLAGIEPKSVCEWYLAVYADAFEWVELPNTHGMALFADGGLLSSKPYAASGKYIDRMSDYCRSCRFDVRQTEGETACPFNLLYWNFLAENREKLAGNPRMALIYKTLANMPAARLDRIRQQARAFLRAISPTDGDEGHAVGR